MLVRDLERFLARRQHPHAGGGRAHGFDKGRHLVGDVLAVVEHEKHVQRSQNSRQGRCVWALTAKHGAQHAGHRRRHCRTVGDGRQVHPPDAVGEVRSAFGCELTRDALRHARLADAARADDGNHGVRQ